MNNEQTTIESTIRRQADRPTDELARELGQAGESVDPHIDPDFDDPAKATESATEATQWRVAKSLLKLRTQVNAMAPNRSKASDGTIGDIHHCGQGGGTSDHCPKVKDGGIGVVTAMDVTHDPARGCDAGRLAASIRESRDLRVKYVIWNRRIANSSPIGGHEAWAWRQYNGANPHSHHVHISVKADKASFDDEGAWRLPGTETGEAPATS